jgi:hypothetical protein
LFCFIVVFLLPCRWLVSEIIISGVERKDDGLYECQARNEGGTYFKSGHIQVRIKIGSCASAVWFAPAICFRFTRYYIPKLLRSATGKSPVKM